MSLSLIDARTGRLGRLAWRLALLLVLHWTVPAVELLPRTATGAAASVAVPEVAKPWIEAQAQFRAAPPDQRGRAAGAQPDGGQGTVPAGPRSLAGEPASGAGIASADDPVRSRPRIAANGARAPPAA